MLIHVVDNKNNKLKKALATQKLTLAVVLHRSTISTENLNKQTNNKKLHLKLPVMKKRKQTLPCRPPQLDETLPFSISSTNVVLIFKQCVFNGNGI